jgi:hypothetical protein
MDSRSQVRMKLLFLFLFLSPLTLVAEDYRFDVQLLQDSDLACGIGISSKEVKVIDIQPLLHNKIEAVSNVHAHVPDHGLESPIPVLIEKAHLDGRTNRSALLRNAVRESASLGCDLLIVLDVAVLEKLMLRPQSIDLKLPVSYVLVVFGSQVKNSAKHLIK